MQDIREISSLLDETIQKGEEVEQKRIDKSKRHRQSIRKALSFNPLHIEEVGADSGHYNPYEWNEAGGGFTPHSPEHWAEQGKLDRTDIGKLLHHQVRDPEGYREAKEYYKLLQPRLPVRDIKSIIKDTLDRTEFQKALPVGTVHEWNGVPFKKIGPGQWVPVHQGAQKDHPIEQHAQKKTDTIKEILGKRKKGEAKEPSFDDRAKQANQRQKDIETRENELGAKEIEHTTRDQDLRERGLGDQEKEKETRGVTGNELKAKVAKRAPGKGEHVDLTKSELTELLDSGTYAFISAGVNPSDEKDRGLDDKKVKARYDELEKELVDKGYAYTRVKGHYGEAEDSFLVMAHEADRKHVMELGKKMNQDSVIYSEGGKHEMIYTTGENAGKKHDGSGHQVIPNAEDYYTELTHPDGSTTRFSLNFDFDKINEAGEKHGTATAIGPEGKETKLEPKKDEPAAKAAETPKAEPKKAEPKKPDDKKKDKDYGDVTAIGPGGKERKLEVKKVVDETKKHKSTYDQYKDESGGYVDERAELHDQIANLFLDKVKKSSKPVMILSGGGSASGKSTVLHSALSDFDTEVAHIDADAIKENIPEYKAMVAAKDESAAAHAHQESSQLASRLIGQAFDSGKPFVYDSTMKNPEKMKKVIQEAKKRGYGVHIVFADLDKKIAHERASKRAAETGRKVPRSVINASHEGAIKTLGDIHHLADSVSVYSNKGAKPEIAYQRQGEEKTVTDHLYQDMLKRGHTIKSEKPESKGDYDLVNRILEKIKKTKVGHERDNPGVSDEGVAHDEYPKGTVKSKRGQK
jgi:predicted ABC-type ATPase